jgi:hypothetical protein
MYNLIPSHKTFRLIIYSHPILPSHLSQHFKSGGKDKERGVVFKYILDLFENLEIWKLT